MYTYTKKVDAEGVVTIEKTGVETIEFAPSAVQSAMVHLEKMKKELVSQAELEEAKMENVKSFHEIVTTLTDEQLTAIAVYSYAKTLAGKCRAKLVEVEKQIADYTAEAAEIETQTGVPASDFLTSEPAA